MTLKLTDELRQVIARQPGQPVQMEDPVTHARYVLVQLDVYQQLQRAVEYSSGEPNPRDFYPLVDQLMAHDDAEDPSLDSYQHLNTEKPRS